MIETLFNYHVDKRASVSIVTFNGNTFNPLCKDIGDCNQLAKCLDGVYYNRSNDGYYIDWTLKNALDEAYNMLESKRSATNKAIVIISAFRVYDTGLEKDMLKTKNALANLSKYFGNFFFFKFC